MSSEVALVLERASKILCCREERYLGLNATELVVAFLSCLAGLPEIFIVIAWKDYRGVYNDENTYVKFTTHTLHVKSFGG